MIKTGSDVNGVTKEDVKKEEDEESFVEYVPERLEVDDKSIEAFSDVFARFQFPEEEENEVRLSMNSLVCFC